ncbi:MAG: hypothetical protein ACYDBS_07005 [Acidimicrobiales bacterium]
MGYNNTEVREDTVFADYLVVLKRRWPLIAQGMAAGLLIAGLAYVLLPRTYQSTAAVNVTPTGVPSQSGVSAASRSLTGTSVNPDTEAQIVTSSVVAAKARSLMHTTTPISTLISHVAVTVPPNSSVLDITYSATQVVSAMQGAEAFASAYLAERGTQAQAVLNAEVNRLQGQINADERQLRSISYALGQHPRVASASTLGYDRVRQGQLERQITALNQQVAPLQAVVVTPGQIISTAPLPTTPSAPRKSYLGIGGLFGGLLLGLIVASIIELRDDRIHGPRELRRLSSLPVLGAVSFGPGGGSWSDLLLRRTAAGRGMAQVGSTLVATMGKRSVIKARDSEADTEIDAPVTGNRTVLVLPIDDGEGRWAVAASLCAALATSEGSSTLIASGDSFSLAEEYLVSLSDVEVFRAPGRVADARRLVAILASEPERGFLVVEGSAIAARSDGYALAPYVDAVVVVVELGRTSITDLKAAVDELGLCGASAVGIMALSTRGLGSAQADTDTPDHLKERRLRLAPNPSIDPLAPTSASVTHLERPHSARSS